MSGKWHAYLPTTVGQRDRPRVRECERPVPHGFATRAIALAMLRHDLERQHKAAQEKAAELGRALANLLKLEEESP